MYYGTVDLIIMPCLMIHIQRKEVCALRGKFGPPFSQKLKVAIHENHPIGLLEE